MKPIVAPAAAVLLTGAGLSALFLRQWSRLAGLCIGFLPVFSIALHNWIYGHVFVLFSANANHPEVLVMPPSAYLTALRQLLALDFSGIARVAVQLADWLSGPAESYWTIPLNAAGVAILLYVVLRGRQFDPWLRLVGARRLPSTCRTLHNAAIARYHFLTWFLTLLVVMVFMRKVAIGWLSAAILAAERIANHRCSRQLASTLARLQKVSA